MTARMSRKPKFRVGQVIYWIAASQFWKIRTVSYTTDETPTYQIGEYDFWIKQDSLRPLTKKEANR